MPPYDDTLRFLLDLQLFGIKVGLRNIRSLLSYLGQPQKKYPAIHVAGTNGKGSTASMTAAILTSSGYRTGLYTSPHLIHFSERIRVDGEKIPGDYIVSCAKILKPAIEKLRATFFEATTAIAFKYFADCGVDIAVIETGLGGRLDATNVVSPVLSIITNIGLEHTEHLGKTLSSIAGEKGGIIKPGVACITGTQPGEALERLKSIAEVGKSPLFRSEELCKIRLKEDSLKGILLSLKTPCSTYENLYVSLAGEHQLRNLQLAVLAAEYVGRETGFSGVTRESVRIGLANVRKFTGLSGRLDVLSVTPLIIADVAHNPDGIEVLARAVRRYLTGKVVLLFGIMKDKPASRMVSGIGQLARLALCVSPMTARALSSRIITREFHSKGWKALDGHSVEGGLKIALSELRRGEPLLLTGSHYVVGEALNFLNILA